ncbi:Protein of unknown function [Streptomyces sp. WMMB 322]|nr:Protein of unknown function [Streptomyces sp. WMMB 322]
MIVHGAVFDWTEPPGARQRRAERPAPHKERRTYHPRSPEKTFVSSKSHATLRYTAMRAGVFAGCLLVVAVLAYTGIIPEGIGRSNPLWIVLLALVVSAPLSFVLLRKQRDAMSEQLVDGVGRAKERLSANQSQEDGVA